MKISHVGVCEQCGKEDSIEYGLCVSCIKRMKK